MGYTEPLCAALPTDAALSRCTTIRQTLREAGLFADDSSVLSDAQTPASWRISPCPFLISHEQLRFFSRLGPPLLSFYRAVNRLYLDSVRGVQPGWAAAYLDRGKPEALVTFSRMRRFRDDLPAVIRPDIIPTQDGLVITELDSVPGGIGLTAAMNEAYEDLSPPLSDGESGSPPPRYHVVGGRDGMVRGFQTMLDALRREQPGCLAIVVSEEARDYRPEMAWLATRLRDRGLHAYCVEPRDVRFTEEGLFLQTETGEQRIGWIYRFYELFDLLNIPKAELIQYAVKKGWVGVTPPYKPALEEKSAFALLHHPVLRPFWEKELGANTFLQLTTLMPRTWLLDPAPIPPIATIPGLHIGGRAVTDWQAVASATQKERHLVIKPSGFSELAWGSRGVSVGHDMPQTEWAAALQNALAAFPRTPYVLQEFHKGRLFEQDYMDVDSHTLVRMSGRVRLSPYYFVTNGNAELGGILATVCPADKKIIHGMQDAIMAPCAVLAEPDR